MKTIKRQFGTSILLITHNLGVIAEMADRVAVMYAGNVVEYTDAHTLFSQPKHPYTAAYSIATRMWMVRARSWSRSKGGARSDQSAQRVSVPPTLQTRYASMQRPRATPGGSRCWSSGELSSV